MDAKRVKNERSAKRIPQIDPLLGPRLIFSWYVPSASEMLKCVVATGSYELLTKPKACHKNATFNLAYVIFPLTSRGCHVIILAWVAVTSLGLVTKSAEAYRGAFDMITQVLSFVRNVVCQKNQGSHRRMKMSSEKALKHCQFCRAKVTCSKKVCQNCFKPFTHGLAGEMWIAQDFGRQSEFLETVDSVKFRKSGLAVSVA